MSGRRGDNQKGSGLVIFQFSEGLFKTCNGVMALFEKSVKRKSAKGSRTVRRPICRQFVFFSGAPLINEEEEVQRNYQEEQRDDEKYCARVTFHDQFRV